MINLIHYGIANNSNEFEDEELKALNYTKQYNTYKELIEGNPKLQISIELEGVDILKEKIPFGKYRGMTFIDLIGYDKNYFDYMKNLILHEPVSNSLNTYGQRVKMIRVMISVERYFIIERWGEGYERGKGNSEHYFK